MFGEIPDAPRVGICGIPAAQSKEMQEMVKIKHHSSNQMRQVWLQKEKSTSKEPIQVFGAIKEMENEDFGD